MVLKELFKAITTLPQTRKKTNPHSSLLSDAHHLYFSCRKLRAKFDGKSEVGERKHYAGNPDTTAEKEMALNWIIWLTNHAGGNQAF